MATDHDTTAPGTSPASAPYPADWGMAPFPESRWDVHGSEWSGDGYDFMHEDLHARTPFRAVSSWGRDGWDLGDWPYVIIAHAHGADGRWYVVQRVEGDVYGAGFDTREDRDAFTDRLARTWWERDRDRGPDDLDSPAARGPFSRARLDAETGGDA